MSREHDVTWPDALSPLLEARGLDLVDVEVTGPSSPVFVDRAGGVDLDALAEATRDVSAALDELDPLPGRYTLEVSSPGSSGACARPAHFARAVGETVTVRIDAGTARSAGVTGTLEAADETGASWTGPTCRAASCGSPTTRSSGRARCSSGGRRAPESEE